MISRRTVSLALSAGLVLGMAPAAPPAQESGSLPRVVLPNRFDYHDDHDGRRLADIRLKVVERDGRPALALVISAVGPQVEAIPGFAGVRGANRHTAEQIENILTGRFSFVVTTTTEGDSATQLGQWRAGRRGSIPERRLRADGRIDFLGRTPREYPLELIVETAGLARGRQTTELWLDDVPRLRAVYQVADNEVRVLEFKSLGKDPAGKAPPRLVQARLAQQAPEEVPAKAPVTDAEWNVRDAEGKWALYQSIVSTDEERARGFIPYLVRRKDHDFLETIAIHQPLYTGGKGIAAAWALARADAPQWLRVAAWQRQMEIDHGETETSKLILKHNPAKALAWLEKYAAEVVLAKGEKANPRQGQRSTPVLTDLENLRKAKVKPGELGTALPPLRPAEVFRHLDAPADLENFGDRHRADSGKVYVHQVLRAIQAFRQSGRYREPWIGKLLRLTRHGHLGVRLAALLAFADIGHVMDPKDTPVDEFRQVMDNKKETPAIREAALMAFSALGHPQVYVRLHEMALETDHVAWQAAISRLNDIGDEFTLEHLDRVDRSRLGRKDLELLEKHRAQLKKWAEDPQRSRELSLAAVERRLERAAWAEYARSPVRKALTAWTKVSFADQANKSFEKHLETVRAKYSPEHAVPDPAALIRLVREL